MATIIIIRTNILLTSIRGYSFGNFSSVTHLGSVIVRVCQMCSLWGQAVLSVLPVLFFLLTNEFMILQDLENSQSLMATEMVENSWIFIYLIFLCLLPGICESWACDQYWRGRQFWGASSDIWNATCCHC